METINHEYYVSPEVAKLLREAGFDWKCYKVYKTDVTENLTLFTYAKEEGYRNTSEFICSAPTLDVVQRWLREVKAIHICVKPNEASANCKYFVTVIVNDDKWGNVQDENKKTILHDTYEEAQEAGIKKALELILEKEE